MSTAMKRFASVFVAGMLFACGGSGGSGGFEPDPEPDPDEEGGLRIINNSPDYIVGIYSTPSDVSAWGNNLLTRSLAPGATVTLTTEWCDEYYDLRLVDDDRDMVTIDEILYACGTIRDVNIRGI